MSFNTALSGIQAATSDLGVIGNNIANVGTVGFKESRAEFADVYAASAFGSSGNTIGTGVRLSNVSQQFTQGTIKNTNNNLDIAINGQGFFILDDNGASSYTRAGAFELDRNGYIVNAQSQHLRGYAADSSGNIVATLTDLTISTANLSPVATTSADVTANLDARQLPPANPWDANIAFGGSPPSATTYNNSTATTVYDSLGNPHLLTMYFVKSTTANNWGVHFQIDGVDITNSAKTNNYTSDPGSLVTAGTLTNVGAGHLTINGIAVPASAADGVSTSDTSASAISIAATINSVSGTTNVTAVADATTLNLGVYTPGTLVAGQFTINGQNIVVGAATQAALLAAIAGASGVTGVTAAANADNEIVLTAADGRNITLGSNAGSAAATFTDFDLRTLNGTYAQRGTVTLSSASPITIAGTAPNRAGLTALDYISPFTLAFNSDGTYNATNSELISLTWDPLDSSGAQNGSTTPQSIDVDLSTLTQFGGSFAVQALAQDGYTTGRLHSLEVDSSGVLFGRYTNGQSLAMGQITLANFANTQGLQSLGETSWSETFTSGPPIIGTPGSGSLGLVQASSLEDSNVQLTDQLVNLIVAQRNFQANAQTIRTEDSVTQAVINIR